MTRKYIPAQTPPLNYLQSDNKRTKFAVQEAAIIVHLYYEAVFTIELGNTYTYAFNTIMYYEANACE